MVTDSTDKPPATRFGGSIRVRCERVRPKGRHVCNGQSGLGLCARARLARPSQSIQEIPTSCPMRPAAPGSAHTHDGTTAPMAASRPASATADHGISGGHRSALGGFGTTAAARPAWRQPATSPCASCPAASLGGFNNASLNFNCTSALDAVARATELEERNRVGK